MGYGSGPVAKLVFPYKATSRWSDEDETVRQRKELLGAWCAPARARTPTLAPTRSTVRTCRISTERSSRRKISAAAASESAQTELSMAALGTFLRWPAQPRHGTNDE